MTCQFCGHLLKAEDTRCAECGAAAPTNELPPEPGNYDVHADPYGAVAPGAGQPRAFGFNAPQPVPPPPAAHGGVMPPSDFRATPSGISRFDTGGRVMYEYHWRNMYAYGLLVVCAFWGYGMVQFLTDPIDPQLWSAFGTPQGVDPLQWLFVAGGAMLAYYTAACLLNHTTIELAEDRLSVRHGPLPWRRSWSCAPDNISSLFTHKRVSYSRRGIRRTYELAAVLKSGQRRMIIRGASSREPAEYLKAELDAALEPLQQQRFRGTPATASRMRYRETAPVNR